MVGILTPTRDRVPPRAGIEKICGMVSPFSPTLNENIPAASDLPSGAKARLVMLKKPELLLASGNELKILPSVVSQIVTSFEEAAEILAPSELNATVLTADVAPSSCSFSAPVRAS